ncbi:MAG: hypothetical protein WBA46_00150 [Thermomicrobiales bacterium]
MMTATARRSVPVARNAEEMIEIARPYADTPINAGLSPVEQFHSGNYTLDAYGQARIAANAHVQKVGSIHELRITSTGKVLARRSVPRH